MISTRSALGSTPALTYPELAEPRGFSFLRHSSLTLTAVLVDAGFFLKRAARIYGHQTQFIDYGRSDLAEWRRAFHQHLRSLRKVALCLGYIPTSLVRWQLNPRALKVCPRPGK
jgi:hypothetical protein